MTAPPVTVRTSRLVKGTLHLGAAPELDMSCQVKSWKYTPAYADDGDVHTMLCGDVVPAGRKRDGETIEGTIIQDFDFPESDGGVIDYVFNHELERVPFTFVPNESGPTYTGDVLLERFPEGGEAGGTLTADFAWVAFNVDKTYPAAG